MSLDNFKCHGQYFLILLDISTKFFVVRPVPSLNTDAIIQILTAVFSEHRLPHSIRCDRGKNFIPYPCQQYCQHLGITLSFSSTYQHSGNPAERAIRMIKGLMHQCTMAKQLWRIALIEYLVTPLDSNTLSLSELNDHRFNSLLPNISHNKHSDQLVDRHDAQLQCNKRGHVLPELSVGSTVGYHDYVTNKFNVGVVSGRDARLYTIHTENGTHISKTVLI